MGSLYLGGYRALMPATRTAVIGLLAACRPSAVIGRVGAVVVDAVKRLALWASSHISKECAVVVSPSLADGDASASIVWEGRVCGSRATFLHASPDLVLSGLVRLAVDGVPPALSSRGFLMQAPATARVAGNKRLIHHGAPVAAITLTLPSSSATTGNHGGLTLCCHNEPAETLSYVCWHGGLF